MNKTVELVNEWARFEEKYPEGSIGDFCRYYLGHNAQKDKPDFARFNPYQLNGALLRTIGRIGKFNMLYANISLKDTGLNQIEEFGLLLTIEQEKNPRKSDIIQANLQELSSGTDMLNRLKSRGLIEEYNDPEDKRSKRVKLTSVGEKVLLAAKKRIGKMSTIMLANMPDEDKKLCISLLKELEIKYSEHWQQDKNKTFEEIF
jgi:DNA-binding MarR family transcriptional regulator